MISYQKKIYKLIDFEKALQYPLSPITLSIIYADGTRRKTDKSKLKDILFKGILIRNQDTEHHSKDAVVVDMSAFQKRIMVYLISSSELCQRTMKELTLWLMHIEQHLKSLEEEISRRD